MHSAAYEYVAGFATTEQVRVVEFGSLNINGTVRHLFPGADYHGIDVVPGACVDEVADAATWTGEPADLVVSCEVLEHTPAWREIVANAWRNLNPGGRVVITCAGTGRAPHSAVDGGGLRPGEFYANVTGDELRQALAAAGFQLIEVSDVATDTRGTGVK